MDPEIEEVAVEFLDDVVVPADFALVDIQFNVDVAYLFVFVLGLERGTSMKLVMSICLVLLTFLMSLILLMRSLLTDWATIVVVRLELRRSLNTRFEGLIIFYRNNNIEAPSIVESR